MSRLPRSLPTTPVAAGTEQVVIPTTPNRRWSVVGLLFLASMINYFDRATLTYALPTVAADFHLDPVGKGLVLSAFFWPYALMQVPMGILADRLDLRWVYAGAFSLWSLAQGLTGLAESFWVLILFRMLLGIGEAIYLPGGTKAVSLLFPLSERGLPCGLFDFGTRTGLFLEGLIIPALIERYGWRPTFVGVGLAAFLWLVPWFSMTPRPLRAPRTARSTRLRPSVVELARRFPWPVAACGGVLAGIASFVFLAARSLRAGFTGAPIVAASSTLGLWGLIAWLARRRPAPGPERSRRELLRRGRNLFGICLAFFCFDYYWYLLMLWLPDYLVTVRKFTLLKAGICASLPFLVFGLSQPLGGWIADSLVRRGWDETRTRKGIVTGAFLSGLLLIPAALAHSPYSAVALLSGACLVGLATGNMLVILQCCAPAEEVGLWIGIYNLVGNIAGGLGPVVTGLLIKSTESYTPAFVLAAVMIVAAILPYWLIVGDLGDPKGAALETEKEA